MRVPVQSGKRRVDGRQHPRVAPAPNSSPGRKGLESLKLKIKTLERERNGNFLTVIGPQHFGNEVAVFLFFFSGL